ncbi:polyprenyl synthetase family protein [soil metagenome]
MTDTSVGEARSIEAQLRAHAELVADACRPYLPRSEPRRYLYDLVSDYPSRGGKAIRSSLCLATCRAFGGRTEDALPTAAAIELLHNAFLVHDDLADGSSLRRGQPTLHAQWGVGLAVNTGDAMAIISQAPLRDNVARLGTRLAGQVADEFDTTMRRTVEGQAIELGWQRDNVEGLRPEDYLDLIMRKTCWYTTISPMRIGGLIGSWGTVSLDRFVRFGFYLGAAFQIQYDLLNLVGDEERYGKEIQGDLWEGKRTLMLIHLQHAARDDERDFLRCFLAKERRERTDAEVRTVSALIDEHGSLDYARHYAAGIASAATDAFEEAFVGVDDSPDRRFVEDLIGYMLQRHS